MKSNFKKLCAGAMSLAMIGSMTAAFAAEQTEPEAPAAEQSTIVFTVADSDGNVKTYDGRAIQKLAGINLKSVGDIGEISIIAAGEGGGTGLADADGVEAVKLASYTIEDDGAIKDADGNVIGNINDDDLKFNTEGGAAAAKAFSVTVSGAEEN